MAGPNGRVRGWNYEYVAKGLLNVVVGVEDGGGGGFEVRVVHGLLSTLTVHLSQVVMTDLLLEQVTQGGELLQQLRQSAATIA